MKKKGLVIASIVALVLIVSITCIFGYISSRDKTRKEVRESLDNNKITKQCIPFTGGSYTLKFDTLGGNEIEDMNICIACSPDSYKDIPIPEKEGFTFDGWYSDKKLTKKIDFTNTKDIKAVPKYDKDNCMTGYKNITLYANWSDVQLRVEEETPPLANNSQPRSGGQSSGENNGGQPTQETVPDYPLPPVNTTKVYKPISGGYLRGGYGRLEGNNNVQLDVLFHNTGDDKNLYPINDGEVIGFFRKQIQDEIIYKTNIDGQDYYVMYYSYNRLQPARDYKDVNNRSVSYNNPIAIVTNQPIIANVPYTFRVKMAPVTGDYGIIYKNSNLINPNQFFKLKQGESFYER